MRFAVTWPKDLVKPEAITSERDFCPTCFWTGHKRDLERATGRSIWVPGGVFRNTYQIPEMEKLPCPGCGAEQSTFGLVVNRWPLLPILKRPESLQATVLIDGWQQPGFEHCVNPYRREAA